MKAPVMRLYLLRHGEPADTRMFYGHSDVLLSPRGHEHVAAQVEALHDARLDAIHSSDLVRARLGADAIAAAHGLTTVVDEDLREMHLGKLENVPYAEAMTRFPELAGRSYKDMLDYAFEGGGESVRDVARRVLPKVGAAVVELAAAGAEAFAVYAHNTVVRVLLAEAAGAGPAGYGRFEQRYGAINRVDFERTRLAEDPWAAASIAFCNLDPSTAAGVHNL
jgi:broad specificity phosphatase PhoE